MKKKNIIILLLLSTVLSGCGDYLEPNPRKSYKDDDAAWSSLERTNLYVNGFYVPLRDYGPYGNTYAHVGMSDGLTDILKYNSNGLNPYGGDLNKVVFNGQISPTSNPLENYNYIYNRIRRINEFLHNIDLKTKYAQVDRDRLVAQARFFRAFLYTMLVRNHGSIVLRTELDGPDKSNKARSSEAECWKFVQEDLDYAAAHLPDVWPDPDKNLGRITSGAVEAFKTRAMLYAGKWDEVIKSAAKVMAQEGKLYALMPDYADVFKSDDNKEAVLAFRFGGAVVQDFDRWYAPAADSKLNPKSIAGPTQELVDAYAMKDGSPFDWKNPTHAAEPYANREPRFYASILYNGAQWKGRTIETFVGGKDGFVEFGSAINPNATTTGYYIRKLLDEKQTNLEEKSAKDWIEVRYAEVLLNHAEAANEAGKIAEALKSLNKIRTRAQLPEIKESDGNKLRDIIRKERMIELAFEGHRYWDLRRWRLAENVLKGKRMHGMKITKLADGKWKYERVDCDGLDRYFDSRYYHFPISQEEIKNNTACTQLENW